MKKTKISGIVLSAVVACSIVNPIAHAEHITPKHTAEGNITYNEEFDTLDTEKWSVIRHNIENPNPGIESKNNVSVENGNLVIKTNRHCVTGDEVPNKDNISEEPCGTGETTRYTTGRIENTTSLDGNTSYRVDIRAKVESNGTTGTQPALWLQRNNTSYCQKKDWDSLGEIDIFESFKGNERRTHSGAILSCDGEGPEGKDRKTFTKGTQAELYEDGVLNEWHTWSAIYDKQNETFEFLLDEKPVPISKFWYTRNKKVDSSSTGSKIDINKDYGLTEEQKREILDHTYRIILNDTVKINDTNLLKNNEKFPEQRFLVDSVVVREYDKSPYEIEDPKDTSSENTEDNTDNSTEEKPGDTSPNNDKDTSNENTEEDPKDTNDDNIEDTSDNNTEEKPGDTPTNNDEDDPNENTGENTSDDVNNTSDNIEDNTIDNTPGNTENTYNVDEENETVDKPSSDRDLLDNSQKSTVFNRPTSNSYIPEKDNDEKEEDSDDNKVDNTPVVQEKNDNSQSRDTSNFSTIKNASSNISPSHSSPQQNVVQPAQQLPINNSAYEPKVGPTVDTGGHVHMSWWKRLYNAIVG